MFKNEWEASEAAKKCEDAGYWTTTIQFIYGKGWVFSAYVTYPNFHEISSDEDVTKLLKK